MVDWVSMYVVLPMLSLAIVLVVIRALWGPTLPDRVVALDVLTTMGTALLAVWAIRTNQTAFLDAGLVLALLAFLSTVAFARYVERRE